MTHSPTSAWEWELQSALACEEAARCLRSGQPDRAAEWSRLALFAQEVARLKKLEQDKHGPDMSMLPALTAAPGRGRG